MAQLSGDTSACARAKDGQSFPAYKFHEGRATALRQVVRQLRTPGDEVAGVVDKAAARWQEEVDRCSSRGRDWQAYAAGGLDAIRSLESWTAAADIPRDPTLR